jgi:type III secretory pathway component EscR
MRMILILAMFCLLPIATNAHHSTNTNFTQEIISIDGVIERVRFQNPHASVLIKNIDTEGNEIFWLIETNSRTTLQRQGVSLDSLEVGSTIKATGRKGRRQYTMYLQEITFTDGPTFTPTPDRD